MQIDLKRQHDEDTCVNIVTIPSPLLLHPLSLWSLGFASAFVGEHMPPKKYWQLGPVLFPRRHHTWIRMNAYLSAQLRAELQDQSQFVVAVQGAVENRAVVAALGHARMQAEDFRAQLMRHCWRGRAHVL